MFNYTTILDSTDDYDQAIQLIEDCFEYTDKNSYQSDFSPLVNSTNWQNLHILKDGDKVIAHIGTRIVKTVNDIPLLFIGGIAVSKDYQKQGLFNELFDKVINLYKNEIALVMLWSNLDGLYEKYEIHQAGVLIQTGTEDFSEEVALQKGFKKLSFPELDSAKLSEVRACYEASINKHFITVRRGPIEWGVLSTITSTDLYVHETNNIIDFYFFVNKGMDLQNIIHEFAGINIQATSLGLEKIKSFKTWIPSKNPWIKPDQGYSFYMGLFKVGKPELFLELIYIWSDGEIEVTKISNSNIFFKFQDHEYTKTHAEFFSLLMGPERAADFLNFEKELWITGLDSI